MMQCVGKKSIVVRHEGVVRCMNCGMQVYTGTTRQRCNSCGCRRVKKTGLVEVTHGVRYNPLTGGPWPYNTDCVPLAQALKDAEKKG